MSSPHIVSSPRSSSLSPTSETKDRNRKIITGAILLCVSNVILAWAFVETQYQDPKDSDKKPMLIGKAFIVFALIELIISAFLYFIFRADPFVLFVFGGRFLELILYVIFSIFSTVLDRL